MKSLLSNNNTFVHSGTVSRISGNSVFVSLDRNVHCDGCRIKAACGISDSKNKEVETDCTEASFQLNESVQVVIRKDQGFQAVFWAYLFPFLLVIAVLVVASLFLSEWQAGLLALLLLIPYYGILHLMNSFFRKKFRISVLKLT